MIFFAVLLGNYFVWFHLWPWAAGRLDRKRNRQPSPEHTARIAVRGFLFSLAILAALVVLVWIAAAG